MKKNLDPQKFRLLNTDEQFRRIVDDYARDLYWVIRPIVKTHENADDVLQNTLIKVYKALPGFRFESQIFSWLYRIAVNEALSYLKKHINKHKGDYLETLTNMLHADPYYDGNEILLKLEKALLQLPEKQQEVFRLKYFNNLKFSEISELTGTTQGALKASYHLAVKKLKKILSEN